MSDIKLLHCPFCGGVNVRETYNNFVPALLCCDCGAMMTIPMATFGTSYKKIITEKWNTRKPMERIVDRLEQLQKEEVPCEGCPFYTEIDCYIHCDEYKLMKAIEIVKQINVSDDVCEWKYNNSEYYWESSCENLHIFMSDGPEENGHKFCPYCGKKIKVVE